MLVIKMMSLNLKSKLIAFPLLITFALFFFYFLFFMQLSLFLSFLGFNLSLFGVFITQRFLKNSIKAKTIKRLLFLASIIFLITLLISPVQAASILEYNIPTPNSKPTGIAVDLTNNKIFFTEFGADKIGKLDITTGAIEEYSLSTGSRPFDIAFDGSDIWFTERYVSNKIGRLDQSGVIHEYQLPASYPWSNLWGITVDSNGNVWFASNAYNFIGKFDKTTMSIFTIPTPNSAPRHLVYDPRGPFIWFTMNVANKIGRLNPSAAGGNGEITEYSLPATLNGPDHIAIDSFGFIWFTCEGSNTIGKLNPWTGEFTTIYTSGVTRGIAVDSSNNVWFTLPVGKIARYSPPLNLITEFSIPTSPSTPEEILIQESSPITVWFTEYDGSKIGKLTPGAPFTTSTVTALPTASSTTGTSSISTSSTLSTTFSTSSAQFIPAVSTKTVTPSTTIFPELTYYLQVTTTATATSTTTVITTTTTYATFTSYIATTSGTTTATLTVYSPTVTVTTTTSTTTTATSTTYATTTTATSTTTSWTTIPTTITTTQTSTIISWITTTATTATTPAMPAPIIPGFPIESIIAGLASGALALSMLRKIKKH